MVVLADAAKYSVTEDKKYNLISSGFFFHQLFLILDYLGIF